MQISKLPRSVPEKSIESINFVLRKFLESFVMCDRKNFSLVGTFCDSVSGGSLAAVS